MKQFFSKAFLTLLIVAVGGGGYFWYAETHAPCVAPISYHMSAFDNRFGVSQAEFLSAMNQAAGIWNKAAGKTILTYDKNGSLPVNLVYDSREATTQKNQNLETTIEQGKQVADSVQQEYRSLKTSYDTDSAAYKAEVASYEGRLDAYNQEVEYWNQ